MIAWVLSSATGMRKLDWAMLWVRCTFREQGHTTSIKFLLRQQSKLVKVTLLHYSLNPNPHCSIAITKAVDEKIHFSPTPCTAQPCGGRVSMKVVFFYFRRNLNFD
jgi:hypothetical protein